MKNFCTEKIFSYGAIGALVGSLLGGGSGAAKGAVGGLQDGRYCDIGKYGISPTIGTAWMMFVL